MNTQQENNKLKEQALASHQQGDLIQARTLYENYLEQNSRDVDVLNMLATLESGQGNFERANELLTSAINEEPEYGYLYYSKALLLLRSKNLNAAIELLAQALSFDSSLEKALRLLGHLYQQLDCFDKAIPVLEEYQRRFSSDYNLEVELAYCYQKTGQLQQAINSYNQSLKSQQNSDIYFNLAMCLTHNFQWQLATENINQTLKLSPENLKFKSWQMYINQLNCEWQTAAQDKKYLEDRIGQKLSDKLNELPPGYLLNVIGIDDFLHAKVIKKMGYLGKPEQQVSKLTEHQVGDIINIGYLSPDFRNHAVGMLLSPVIQHHDRTKFKITGYSLRENGDELNLKFKQEMDQYYDLSKLTSEQIATKINQHKIDILVDLSGMTDGSNPEILSYHPAKIQIGLWGYLNSMGSDFWDFIITDKTVWPENAEKNYTEKPLFLNRSLFSSAPAIDNLTTAETRSQLGFPEDAIIIGSFNNSYKITQQWFDGWLSLLQKNHSCWLWLYVPDENIKNNLLKHATQQNRATDRIIFAEKVSFEAHLKRIQVVDLFADSFGYNAGATATATTIAGVPILTLKGSRMLDRMGASINNNVGMDELICENQQQYWQKAQQLIANKNRLKIIKDELKNNIQKVKFGDAKEFCKDLEGLFIKAIATSKITEGSNSG